MQDLSKIHHLITDLFKWPASPADWEQYRLSNEQVAFFREYGYLADVKLLEEWQIERLKTELEEIMDPTHPSNQLYHEFHSNESSDPEKILFHALGAWRIAEGFHDVLWNPAFVMAAPEPRRCNISPAGSGWMMRRLKTVVYTMYQKATTGVCWTSRLWQAIWMA